VNLLKSGYENCENEETIFVSSVSTIFLSFQVTKTLIIVSKPVLSHFSSTVFDLSCVNAEVSFHDSFHFSSCSVKNISKNATIHLKGFNENQELFHFIILLDFLLHSHCQSSSIGFNNICMEADSSSSSLENEFVMLFIGSLSNF